LHHAGRHTALAAPAWQVGPALAHAARLRLLITQPHAHTRTGIGRR
jgi:hypothetical protein